MSPSRTSQSTRPTYCRFAYHLANWCTTTKTNGYWTHTVIIDVVRPHLGNSNTGGDNQIPPKTGNIRGGFPLQHIPSPQKGGKDLLSIPKHYTALFSQNTSRWRHSHPEGQDWLAKVNLKGVYFAVPILQISSVSVTREDLPVYLSSLQSLLSTVDVYKGSEASSGLTAPESSSYLLYILLFNSSSTKLSGFSLWKCGPTLCMQFLGA